MSCKTINALNMLGNISLKVMYFDNTASLHKLAAGRKLAAIILEWSIIIRFIITTTFKTCATTHLSV